VGDGTGISWTDATWNAVRGCDDVSPGCVNCYAKGVAARFSGADQPYVGLAKFVDAEVGGKRRRIAKWSGAGARFVPEMLELPLRWTRPRRIFVNSMSDLFHSNLSNEEIAAVFGVMAAAPRHIFQVLTKRPERMKAWFEWHAEQTEIDGEPWIPILREALCHLPARLGDQLQEDGIARLPERDEPWPLPNIWLGVTAEDQQRANERIPLLLATPAAVRWVSVEPQIKHVCLSTWIAPVSVCGSCHAEHEGQVPDPCPSCGGSLITVWGDGQLQRWRDGERADHLPEDDGPPLHWVVQGGESGLDARPFDLAWMRDLRDQCARAGVAYFSKQLGARPYESVSAATVGMGGIGLELNDKAGADPTEWPSEYVVQQFPEVRDG
jgi:protein gp37